MKVYSKILLLILPAILLTSCFSNPEHRNQVKLAGVWKISKISSVYYENNVALETKEYEGDDLGEITLLNRDINDYNDCYLRLDSNVQTAFQTNFNEVMIENTTSFYYASDWGTNPSSLKYITFFEINVDPVNARSWTTTIEEYKRRKQKWVYTHFDPNGNVTRIEEIYLQKQ